MLNHSVLNQILNGRARTRLLVALLTGTAVFLLLPTHLFIGMRLLLGWNSGVICFLVLAYRMIAMATPEETNQSAMRQDQSGVTILVLVVLAAGASLFAISFLLRGCEKIDFHDCKSLKSLAVKFCQGDFFTTSQSCEGIARRSPCLADPVIRHRRYILLVADPYHVYLPLSASLLRRHRGALGRSG